MEEPKELSLLDWAALRGPREPSPDQRGSSHVVLFHQNEVESKITPKLSVLWVRDFDCLHLLPDRTVRWHRLNDFLEVGYEAYDERICGFKLFAFSQIVPLLRETIGVCVEDRICLAETFTYYRGICLGADARADQGKRNMNQAVLRYLHDYFGYLTILQPEHAETLPL